MTEKWDGELPIDVCLPEELLQKLCNEIEKLHSLGYVHGDILEKNVLVRKNQGQIVDATLSDFGTVDNDWSRRPDRVKTFYDYHKLSGLAYYNDNNLSLEDVQRDPSLLDKAMMWQLWLACGQRRTCKISGSSSPPTRKMRKVAKETDSEDGDVTYK